MWKRWPREWKHSIGCLFSHPSSNKRRFRVNRMQLFGNGPQSGVFFNRQLIAFVWMDEKVFFQYDNAIHYPAHALCKGCYHIFIVLAFSCGRAKNESNTLWQTCRHVFFPKRSKKISVFKNIRILVNEALMLLLRLETQSYGVTILSIFSVKSDDVTIPYESSLAIICAICLK